MILIGIEKDGKQLKEVVTPKRFNAGSKTNHTTTDAVKGLQLL